MSSWLSISRLPLPPTAAATDPMPLNGIDHVELWVGNAKQAAFFYQRAFGFRVTAYAGLETGVRDRTSYVLEQGRIRLVSRARCSPTPPSPRTSTSTATA